MNFSHQNRLLPPLVGGICFILLLLATGVAFGATCFQAKNDLRGKVKTLKERQYDNSSSWALVAIWEYDQMGKEMQVRSGGEHEGVLISSITAMNFFDDQGRKIRQTRSWDKDPPVQYDQETLYGFDDQGNQSVEAEYGADGSFIYLNFREFDKQGNCIQAYEYKADGPMNVSVERVEYQYDAQGQTLKKMIWRDDETKDIHQYNEKGQVIKTLAYSADGQFSGKTEYDYDVYGNDLGSRTIDSKGNLTSRTTFTYEYDAKKNWVKRISKWLLKEGKPFDKTTIMERTITYYDLPNLGPSR